LAKQSARAAHGASGRRETKKGPQTMTAQPNSAAVYESQLRQFKPEHGLAATNANDPRLFLYEWFTHFERAASVDFYLRHLDDANMRVEFPGQAPLNS
jgi:hypothetical protein